MYVTTQPIIFTREFNVEWHLIFANHFQCFVWHSKGKIFIVDFARRAVHCHCEIQPLIFGINLVSNWKPL